MSLEIVSLDQASDFDSAFLGNDHSSPEAEHFRCLKYLTVAHQYFRILEKVIDVPFSTYELIDDLIDTAKSRIDLDDDARTILRNIGNILKEKGVFDYGFLGESSPGLDNLERPLCAYSSMLYYSILESLFLSEFRHVPVEFAFRPRHVFIKLGDIFWESVKLNKELFLEKEKEKHKLREESIANGAYFTGISSTKFLASAYNFRACVYENTGRIEDALDDFDVAVELNPKFVEPLMNRARLKAKLKDYSGAIDDYLRVAELDPSCIDCKRFASMYSQRAMLKEKNGNLECAIKDYDEAIKLNPDFPNYYSSRARLKTETGDPIGAEKDRNLFRSTVSKLYLSLT